MHDLGIEADVTDGYGLAAISVWAGLVALVRRRTHLVALRLGRAA
ncbi:hypothetical protein [Thermoactinospora rubra]|nr:hypothetical protein [Thermoactinospora rubra]